MVREQETVLTFMLSVSGKSWHHSARLITIYCHSVQLHDHLVIKLFIYANCLVDLYDYQHELKILFFSDFHLKWKNCFSVHYKINIMHFIAVLNFTYSLPEYG